MTAIQNIGFVRCGRQMSLWIDQHLVNNCIIVEFQPNNVGILDIEADTRNRS